MKTFLIPFLALPFFFSCGLEKEVAKIEKKAILINKYEGVALKLAKENRELRVTVKRLEFEIQKLKQESAFKKNDKSTLAEGHNSHGRAIASVPSGQSVLVNNDMVEFKTYKWSAEDMLKIADKEFKEKKFEKAAQFYNSILIYYPHYENQTDEFYFKAGVSAYESGVHHDWTIEHFSKLMNKYPTSQYFRSAKLWVGLTYMKQGEKKKFFETVEEFRKKYRNTNEWKILSSYYEKIEEKTHE